MVGHAPDVRPRRRGALAEDIQTTWRLSAELYARIKALAERERRSFGAMVRILVEEALDARAAKAR